VGVVRDLGDRTDPLGETCRRFKRPTAGDCGPWFMRYPVVSNSVQNDGVVAGR